MAIADTKKVQTMVNIMGQQAQLIKNAVTEMETVRATFITEDPDVTGTPLEGNVVTVSNAINSMRVEADKAVWTSMIAAIVPSHRNEAM